MKKEDLAAFFAAVRQEVMAPGPARPVASRKPLSAADMAEILKKVEADTDVSTVQPPPAVDRAEVMREVKKILLPEEE